MSKYKHIKDEWIREALDEYKDKIDENKSHRLDISSYRVDKPWGHEERWAITEKYLGKILFVEQGHKLSLQYHEQKDETVYVLRGRLLLHVGDKEKQEIIELRMGQSYRITPGVVHRFEAPPDVDVTLIEVSTPEIDDVVRLEDDYNRVKE